MSDPFLGEIRIVSFNFAPVGWAFCNGQILSISPNTALFSLLGTTYGGNGVQTFALPNLQSRVPIGAGQGTGLSYIAQGEMSGVESVSILSSNMPIHTHSLNASTGAAADTNVPTGSSLLGQGYYVASQRGVSTTVNTYSSGTANVSLSPNSISTAGGNTPLPIRNPYLGMYYIIALQGIYPSRN